MDARVAYLLAAAKAFVPTTNHAYYEKPEVTEARYESIAQTVADVSFTHPLWSDDVDGIKTGLILLSISGYESSFKNDIDSCKVGGDKDKKGVFHAWTLWQLHANKEKVCANRAAGATAAVYTVKHSFEICKDYPFNDRLSVYTDGVCKKNWWRSSSRISRAMKWYNDHPYKQNP